MLILLATSVLTVSAPPHDDDGLRPTPSVTTKAPPKPTGPIWTDGDDQPNPATASKSATKDSDDDEQEGAVQPSGAVVVTTHRLDAARTQIDAALGSTVYSLTNDTIENRPGGETGSVADILAQAPGVTLSGTTLNIRGSPANQIRINDVIIPEAISDPADLLSARLADTTRLITGTLPAQFGFAPAGVISITTKNGLYQHGGQAELFVGSDGMIEPAFEWTGSSGPTSFFASGELEHDRSSLSDGDGRSGRDQRTGIDALAFVDHVIDENDRLSLIFGGADERHTISRTRVGRGTELNADAYGVATFQHSDAAFTLQTSVFAAGASDEARFGATTHDRHGSWGAQVDASDALNAQNSVRFGLLATRSTIRELDLFGRRSSAARTSVDIYAQDEWTLVQSLTFNPGVRLEWLRGFGAAAEVEPRASFVWQSERGLSAHVGYARYASAPPLGEVTGGTSLPDERDDYVDAGVQQKLGAVTLGVDGYFRAARNYIAEHQTPGSAVATAFEFQRARIQGVDLSATYAWAATTAWANLSLESAEGRKLVGAQRLFDRTSIAAESQRHFRLASERPITLSGGLTERAGRLSVGADVLVSSGAVRTLSLLDQNGSRNRAYALLGLAAVYHSRIAGKPADLRLDLTNLTNVHYPTSDAANLEGGWTRFGRGRAVTIGIEQGF